MEALENIVTVGVKLDDYVEERREASKERLRIALRERLKKISSWSGGCECWTRKESNGWLYIGCRRIISISGDTVNETWQGRDPISFLQ